MPRPEPVRLAAGEGAGLYHLYRELEAYCARFQEPLELAILEQAA